MALDRCFAELVIVISNNICGIAVFSKPAGYGFSTFWKLLKIVLKVLQHFPSFLQFPIGKGYKLFFVNYYQVLT